MQPFFLSGRLIEERMEEMDWNEIRETGHACYNCSHLKERKRYWIFLLRTYFHQREMEGLQLFFHETPIRARIRAGMPCLMEQATRAFFYKGASFADRIALIKQHIIHLETHLTDDFLLKIYEAHDKITLWADTFEEKPLTMNPFNITKAELNIEKIDFLKNLILLIWKGSDSKISELEFRIIEQIVTDYYDAYFHGFKGYDPLQRETLRKTLTAAEKRKGTWSVEEMATLGKKIDAKIKLLEERRKALAVASLSFNTFYEYSCERLELICLENNITEIDYDKYAYMIQPFYKGGNYDKILNENVDTTLFSETFIVFEVDAIKENKKLFPIVTLIIMDVFLQKMRLKKKRKVLVIEEAWKAIASPLMAEYIKFMYKTARKFWASVGVVTQEIQDIIGSEIVKEAIINNSDVVMLLDQSKFKERFDNIKAILGLTETDCKKIFTINRLENKEGRSFFREVFIRRGTTSEVYGVEEPRECYMTYTTERAEKEALKLYKAELKCSHQEATEAYCRDWKRSGIEKSLPFAQMVNKAGKVLNLKEKQF